MAPSLWKELIADPRMVAALDRADTGGKRSDALVGKGTGYTNRRKNWSNRFADACAVMVANEFRSHAAFRRLHVLPEPDGPNEPRTFTAAGRDKQVDVLAASAVSGLQVGVSLKAMNFRNQENLNVDHNLTGRTYEFQDEAAVIHRYQPAAFLVALYFLPLSATADKRRGPTSFARTVLHLRERTGRLDPSILSQAERADLSVVALYSAGDDENYPDKDFTYRDELPRGVVRYFDTATDPPKRGRPKLASTMSLQELVAHIAATYRPTDHEINWAEPEVN